MNRRGFLSWCLGAAAAMITPAAKALNLPLPEETETLIIGSEFKVFVLWHSGNFDLLVKELPIDWVRCK